MTEFNYITIGVIIIFLLIVLNRKIYFSAKRGIDINTVYELIYTYASSAYPPSYQRYRFYIEHERFYFYHEKREGKSWPLKETDITVSGSAELSEDEWNEFLKHIENGTIEKNKKNTDSGNPGPWINLRCGDCSKSRLFGFRKVNAKKDFELFCEQLTRSKK